MSAAAQAARRAQGGALQGEGASAKVSAFLCRAMRAEDVPACAAVEAAVPDGWNAAALAEELAQPAARLFVAEAAGAQTVFLEMRAQNGAARALYASLGFVQTGMRRGFYTNPRDDAVLLQKSLSGMLFAKA